MDFISYIPANDILSDSDNDDDISYDLGDIEMLVDFNHNTKTKATPMAGMIEDLTLGMSSVKIGGPKKYKKYGPDQIERFITIIQEQGESITSAAKMCGIPRSTAYKLMDEFNRGDGSILPGTTKKVRKPTPKKLFPEHSAFLTQLFDNNPSATLGHAKEELCKNFDGLDVSLVGLYKHLQEKCCLSLKQASKYTLERDTARTLDLRFKIISQWKEVGVDFKKNCVFVDEAGFHSQLMRGRAWSKVGDPAVVKVHTQKGVNLSMIGCISPFGTINFSKVIPLKKEDVALIEKEFPRASGSKKRKHSPDTSSKSATPLRKGTTTYHIVKFMESVMDVLDRHDMKGMFIVMDNCKVHHSHFVVNIINERGYKPLFMPPYSPFLNPIEECWAKIKSHIRRNPLSKDDTLSDRIAEACESVTVEDCQGWIRHAETFWDRCLQREVSMK